LEHGVALRLRGDDRGALSAFERAWKLDAAPRALAQMALAEQALGRWEAAAEHLSRALEQRSDAWITQHRATLEASVREISTHLGGLDVVCNVAGAELSVDGRVLGHTPLQRHLRVAAGMSVLRVSALGYFVVTRSVQIDPGGLSRVDVTLTPEQPPLAGPAARSPSGVAPGRDLLLYGSVGLTGLGVTAALTGYIVREVNVRRFNDDAQCDVDPLLTRSQECRGAATAFRRAEVIATAGAATAAVFGALGLYLWLWPPATAAQLEACGWDGTALVCGGHF
jgi:hypothetical protein